MIVHYLEDNLDWSFYLHHSVAAHRGLALTTSENLEETKTYLARHDVDLVLVDIRRPDSLSLKDDIDQIRRFTSKPILFITQQGSSLTSQIAKKHGALGVLDKSDLTAASFLQEVSEIYRSAVKV